VHFQLGQVWGIRVALHGTTAQTVFVGEASNQDGGDFFSMLDTISMPHKTRSDGGLRCFAIHLITITSCMFLCFHS
jgi:hypothetical protein